MEMSEKTKSVDAQPKFDFRIRASIVAGILGALCWVSGDLLLVGFELKPEKYPTFSETYADLLDPELFTLMLEASTQRLVWGVLLATFSLWLYLLSAYSVTMSVSD